MLHDHLCKSIVDIPNAASKSATANQIIIFRPRIADSDNHL